MRVGLVQTTSSDDPASNLPKTRAAIAEAARRGADLILTPEVTNCVSGSRERQHIVLQTEQDDMTLRAICSDAKALGVHVLIGSLALKRGNDHRLANRSFMIGPTGEVLARYDKIHMFDVTLSETETYKESDGYRPGENTTLVHLPFASVGMTVCYDLRFPQLYRQLAIAGARVLTVPSAFSRITGEAHWHVLLRARAIECGAWVIAPAQTGTHPSIDGAPRKTFGHSLIVDPWGEVVTDMGEQPGVEVHDVDLGAVSEARRRIPSLLHDRAYGGPN